MNYYNSTVPYPPPPPPGFMDSRMRRDVMDGFREFDSYYDRYDDARDLFERRYSSGMRGRDFPMRREPMPMPPMPMRGSSGSMRGDFPPMSREMFTRRSPPRGVGMGGRFGYVFIKLKIIESITYKCFQILEYTKISVGIHSMIDDLEADNHQHTVMLHIKVLNNLEFKRNSNLKTKIATKNP